MCRLLAKWLAWKRKKGHTLNKEMFGDIFNQGIETLIIGAGVHGMIECPDYLIEFLKNNEIKDVIKKNTRSLRVF